VATDIARSAGSELAAVAARQAARAATFARSLGIPRSYGTYTELVTDAEVDIIYVATTHAQHYEHALLALAAGKHLLLEKPFTLTAQKARHVIATARAADLFCMEAMWMRMHPLIRQAHDITRAGHIGNVLGVHADLSHRVAYDPNHRLFDPAVGGGALLDLGVYPAHLAWMFLGRPDSLHADASFAPTGVDTAITMRWNYKDGRVATLTASLLTDHSPGLVVTGSRGRIVIPSPIQVPTQMTVTTGEAETTSRARLPGNGYGPQITEVERRIQAGETASPLAPLDDTAAVLDMLDHARRQIGLGYPEQ
jgi:predicted dehydrogenase